jgi:pimeloyl-ACP methyl ester carboxylesterase
MRATTRSLRGLSLAATASLAVLAGSGRALAQEAEHGKGHRRPIVIEKMSAFAFGGTVLTEEATDSTLHCDHGYAESFIPPNARNVPLVMWHSFATSTWQSTFDGRDGFQQIFLRRGFPVYLIDLPRQGRAGNGCVSTTYTPDIGRDQRSFTVFRYGVWNPPAPPQFFPNVQIPTNDPEFLNQLTRARYPDNEDFEDTDSVEVAAVAALLEKIGPATLVTHSGSGRFGWLTAIESENVKAIVSYEPVTFVFPAGELPPPIAGGSEQLEVPLAEFQKLTRIPLQVVYGDFLDRHPLWVASFASAQAFVEAVNRHGGDAQLLHLPEIGIVGNTHFLMGDLNNREVANLLSQFLREKGLAERGGRAADKDVATH